MAVINLKDARELVGLTQRELDRRAGLNLGTTHDLETARIKRPSHDVVVRITRALQRAGIPGITAEQLFPVPEVVEVIGDEEDRAAHGESVARLG